MSSFRRIEDAGDLTGKTALVRVDFNVPMADGKVTDATRLRAALPTVNALTEKGAKVVLLAHFDRPKGKIVPEMSLLPIASAFSEVLGEPVHFAENCGFGPKAKAFVTSRSPRDVILMENTRFEAGEEKNDPALGDLYVNDAFSAAHRAHASTEGVTHFIPAYAGKAMETELDALEKALGSPQRPVMAVVGGAKVSTKIDLLKNLVSKVDMLAIGGGMANTFLAAQGVDVGKSLCEHDLADTALTILKNAEESGCEILLPVDVAVATEFKAHAPDHRVCKAGEVAANEMILDAGPHTVTVLTAAMDRAKTLVWNGPLGAFELEPFDTATVAAARAAAERTKAGKLIAVAGGGDTVAALNHAGVAADFTFVSTAGGAFLEWMEGKPLPGVEALKA